MAGISSKPATGSGPRAGPRGREGHGEHRLLGAPARELLGTLARFEDSDVIAPGTLIYLRDVYDHALQVSESLEVQRDILASMLDVYHSAMANRMNEIMKVLSIVSTIFIPLTFVVGVYGMNFEFMPELHMHYAYPAVWIVMGLIFVSMVLWFRHKRWI